MATFQQAIEYAKANPTSDFAKQLEQGIKSGALNQAAKQEGIDLTPFVSQTQPKQQKSVPEKIADVTGGKEIAQGLGQAIAQPKSSKLMEESLNKSIDTQSKLLKLIKERKSLGQDTSKLESTLSELDQSISQIGNETGNILNPNNLTGKQVIGDALQLGTTIASVGSYSKAGLAGEQALTSGLQKALPTAVAGATKATGFGSGLVQGAKTGAIAGGAYGASSGISEGLQENKSAGDILKQGITSGLKGAAAGAALGGAIGGISGGVSGAKVARQEKEVNFVLDLVAPKATSEIKQQALREGRVTEQGLLSAGKITPSKRNIAVAETVKDIVSSKNSPIQNIDAISSTVNEINTGVKAYVKENKVPFNTNQLKAQLNKGKDELKLIFASDKQAEKTYDAVVKEFMKHVKSKDTAGLLDARQAFDRLPAIRKLLESQGLGENVKKEIVLTARSKANEYVASLLPKGNKYRETLLKESKMIEAIGNIAEKSTDIIGKNKLQVLTEKYPILKWIAGTAVGAGGVGVGGAIIGSSD